MNTERALYSKLDIAENSTHSEPPISIILMVSGSDPRDEFGSAEEEPPGALSTNGPSHHRPDGCERRWDGGSIIRADLPTECGVPLSFWS